MADFSSSIGPNNTIFVPFEFSLGTLDKLKNILDEMKAISDDLPEGLAAGLEIPQTGGSRGTTTPSEIYPGSAKDAPTKDPEAAKVANDELKELVDELAAEASPSEIQKKIESALDRMASAGVGPKEGLQLLKNPQGFIMGLLSSPAVAAALIAAGYLTVMLEISMMQSGPLDKHFRRVVKDEFIKAIRPLQRRMTQVGIGRQVIFTSMSGFNNPGLAFNSYDALRRGEIGQIDSFQIRKGYKW